MPIFSNINEVAAWLDRVVQSIDMNIPGIDQSMGRDMAHAVADGIEKRSYEKQQGASVQWPKNEAKYLERKKRLYGQDKINFRTGQMISHASLTANLGTIDSGKTMVMQYGTGTAADTSKTGYLETGDKIVTDTEKAGYAHDAERPFFQVDHEIDVQNVMPIAKEALAKYLQSKANG